MPRARSPHHVDAPPRLRSAITITFDAADEALTTACALWIRAWQESRS